MIRHYFRLAWAMMRQNRLFTAIYVVGTGLSVAFAMTLFIIFYIKLGPVYPEYNRERTIYLKGITRVIKHGNNYSAIARHASSILIEKFAEIQGVEAVVAYAGKYGYSFTVNEREKCSGLFVNNNYWQLYEYDFLLGRPFVEADAASQVVIVSDNFAMELFATTDVIGKEININNTYNRIVGVVKSASGATPESFSQFWLPLAHPLCKEGDDSLITGGYFTRIICSSADEKPKVIAQMNEIVQRLAQEAPEGNYYSPQIVEHWAQALRINTTKKVDVFDVNKKVEADEVTFFDAISKYLYVLLALLFIPALNLGGMIASRMAGRMDEIGVRKAFGATNGSVLFQVLCENLLLTAFGALLGLFLSYLLTYSASRWILTLFDSFVNISAADSVITVEMLFNPVIIATTTGLTLLLNLMAAIVPTLFALRKSITHSLNSKR